MPMSDTIDPLGLNSAMGQRMLKEYCERDKHARCTHCGATVTRIEHLPKVPLELLDEHKADCPWLQSDTAKRIQAAAD